MYQLNQKYRTTLSIMGQLQKGGPSSRPALAEALGLYSSTLSIRIKEMLNLGLVREFEPEGGSGPGRRARLLEADPGFGLFGGLYLQQDGVSLALFGPDLVLQRLWQGDYPKEAREPLEDAVRDVVSAAAGEGYFPGVGGIAMQGEAPVRGIGIAVSSVVSSQGRVHPSSHYPYSGGDLLSFVGKLTGVRQLAIDNDANMAALADVHLLEAGESSLLHLLLLEDVPTLGWGLYLQGRLYRGASGAAGEIDEELWPLSLPGMGDSDCIPQAAGLVRFLSTFLDPHRIYVSGLGDETKRLHLERELSGPGMDGTVYFIKEPNWVEKGGAVKVFRQTLQALVTEGNGL